MKWGSSERHYIWEGVRKKESIFPVLKVPRQYPLVLLVEAAHIIGTRFFILFYLFFDIIPEGLHYGILTNLGRAKLGRNFDVTSRRAACEACSAVLNSI
jgi:hypothetical protein